MPEWTYYLVVVADSDGTDGRGGLLRVPADGPVTLAEELTDDGRWTPTDVLFRVRYQGSDDDVRPIDGAYAETLVEQWIRLGRLAGRPDPASSISAEERARLVEADRQAQARWAQVAPPPGLDTIRF